MPARNLLLRVMPREVQERLKHHQQRVELSRHNVLHRPGQKIEDAYFPLDCMISVTITMSDGSTTEVGAVGSREMVGLNAFMGGSETNQTEYVCQVPGTAVRMPAEPLLEEFNENKRVRDVMLRYTQAYIAQLSQNVACNRRHDLSQRLARWLLETRDRMHTDDLKLSHEFVSEMLGVRRSGVTEALGALQEQGVIENARKSIKVLDVAELQKRSCECFAVLKDEYNRLLSELQ